jgi:hypothetical protein
VAHPVRRLVAVIFLVALCAGCHVDVGVDVAMTKDGSGTITVTVTADKDVVAKAPGLAADLRLTDVAAAGWSIDGPAPTPDGGLQVVLHQSFDTPAQANAILSGLNGPSGPLMGLTLARARTDDATSFSVNGTLQVTGGLDAFSDADLLAIVGASPYANQLAAASVAPTDAVSMSFSAGLPGDVKSTTAPDGKRLSWVVPMDGSATDVATATELKDPKNIWAAPLSKAALIALVVWIVISIGFITYVVIARRRRAALQALR